MGTDTATKTCSKCKEPKPLSQFTPSKQKRDGLFPWCRSCKAVSDAASHAKHRESRHAAAAERYRANPEPYKARARARYQRRPEQVKAEVQAWVERNRDKARATKAAWSKRNPESTRESWRRRHARQLSVSVVPFTLEQLAEKMAYWGNQCWVCHGPQEAVDHVKPLAKGGLHVLANLRPICRACNTRKRDRWPYTPPAAA